MLSTACVHSGFSAWNLRLEVSDFIPWRMCPPHPVLGAAAIFFFDYSAAAAGAGPVRRRVACAIGTNGARVREAALICFLSFSRAREAERSSGFSK